MPHQSRKNQDCRLYVGNIDFRMTREDVEDMFGEAGEVVDVYFPKNEDDPRPHKGYIFVQMGSADQTLKAIRMFHQALDDFDRELIVRLADFRKRPIRRSMNHRNDQEDYE